MSRKQKILIVDDEPINIDLLSGLLKPHYALLVAKSGERAIKAADTGKPDLILLDIMMPDMDGYEVCRRLKADEGTRRIPVIFITAMSEIENEAKGLQIGAADYITKPISPSIVMARVNTQLELVRHEEKLQAAYSLIKAQKDRMADELNFGRDIQMSMMPQDFPVIGEHSTFDIRALLVPARELGGDFYDFFSIDKSTVCLCVGDVAGKGVPAALFMAVAKTLVRSAAGKNRSTDEVMTEVNNKLAADNVNCMFVTLFIAICNTDNGTVTYSNAGHNPPFLIKGSGGVVRLDNRHGPVGGAMEDVTYRCDTVSLETGDTLFVYTDGVTEAQNNEDVLCGEERLINWLTHQADADLESLNAAVESELQLFMDGAEQADDITMLSYRYLGKKDSSTASVTASRTWKGLESTIEVNNWFDEFAQSNHIDTKVQRKLNLVIDDLVMNIISYAFVETPEPEVEVSLELDANAIRITFIDNGRQFNPYKEEKPDTSLTIDDRDVGGLGIHLSRELVDEVSYQHADGKNIVQLVVDLPDGKTK